MPPVSTLYLSTGLEPLARKLAAQLDAESLELCDPFLPANVIVPSSDIKMWLQLYLAKAQGVSINIRVQYLENALWSILGDVSASKLSAPVGRLEHESYRLLVLAILLENPDDPDLAPVRRYVQASDPADRAYCRKLWDIADRLARLIRDYEYHRQEQIIHTWIFDRELSLLNGAGADVAALERCQRAIFKRIINEQGGVRERISKTLGKTFKTLPQYAQESIRDGATEPGQWPAALRERPIHLFGVAQISPYHIHLLRWLGARLSMRIYHVNPILAEFERHKSGAAFSRLNATAKACAATGGAPRETLRAAMTGAGVASLRRMAELVDPKPGKPNFSLEYVVEPPRNSGSVLTRLQTDLRSSALPDGKRLPQDKSLQVIACPGIFREVETVYQSILHNLKTTEGLQQNEIAVFVTDMALYRPVIQTIFERDCDFSADTRNRARSPIGYTLSGCSAAESSAFGQALLGMFDAALEGFPRSRVLDILTNPCVLARLNADADQPALWLKWAEQLGVYHGWDRENPSAGGPDGRLYSWRLALQRLRMGRIMDAPGSNSDEPAQIFQDVVPYADLDSADARQLDVFCRGIEGLLPALAKFNRSNTDGAGWAERVRRLIDTFLDAPKDRSEEAAIRSSLINALELLKTLDAAAAEPPEISMPLMREFLASQLEELSLPAGGRFGGVTIAPLQTARPQPFKIVYILGLGEGLYPAPDVVSPFDLREYIQRSPGDMRPADVQRQQFLEILLAVREKLYLLYCSREIQKDQKLYAGALINRLLAYLDAEVLASKFQVVDAPLNAHDPVYLNDELPEREYCDALITYQRTQRLLALRDAVDSGEVAESPEVKRELDAVSRGPFAPPAAAAGADEPAKAHVSIRSLSGFLNNPANESMKRHLQLRGEDETEIEDDEPLCTHEFDERNLVESALCGFVRKAAAGVAVDPVKSIDGFVQAYRQRKLQGLTPGGVFADMELARTRAEVRRRLLDCNGAVALSRKHSPELFCGPVQIGSTFEPLGPRIAFPALHLRVTPPGGAATEAQVSGSFDLVWRTDDRIEMVLIQHGVAIKKVPKKTLARALFDPVLIYLALLAGNERSSGAPASSSSSEWVGGRKLVLTVALEDGMVTFVYSGITPETAREYLRQLSADYLSPQNFDQLLFNVISGEKELRAAYELGEGDPGLAEIERNFNANLQQALETQFEKKSGNRLEPLQLATVAIPDDAFAKVRRRFHLLDLGPRGNR